MLQEAIKNFTALKKNLKQDFTGLKAIKIAIVGDSSTQFLNQALKGYGYDQGYHFDVYEADYDQVEAQLLDTSSELYLFKPEFIVVFQSVQKALKKFYKSNSLSFANEKIQEIDHLENTVSKTSNAKVIYFNFLETNDGVFGNFSNKHEQSFIYQLRKINFLLMDLAIKQKNLNILDFNLINAQFGKGFTFDPKMYYATDMVLSIDVLPHIAKHLTDIISSSIGNFKKCLVIDLDNTMWGGIIGDDGLENIQIGDLGIGKAFTELQLWFKQLKQRGIILAICSKNEEKTAKEPFEKHPDMVLKLSDIAVFVANWNNKADNIRYIQSVLNIGFDSMVFLDDNPVEREIVRTNIPQVLVPELPEDPILYLDYLLKLNLFETASFSEEDEQRTKHYQEEAGRAIEQKNFTNEDDFLKNLNMSSSVKSFNTFNIPRVAQLSQRSNQFNLRTIRYSEEEVANLAQSKNHITLAFTLKDKFGENGLIAVVVLEKREDVLFIETWLMSCRVLKRGMENFTINNIVNCANQSGINRVVGEYLPTSKNTMVKDHYSSLGFVKSTTANVWQLDLANYTQRTCFIELE